MGKYGQRIAEFKYQVVAAKYEALLNRVQLEQKSNSSTSEEERDQISLDLQNVPLRPIKVFDALPQEIETPVADRIEEQIESEKELHFDRFHVNDLINSLHEDVKEELKQPEPVRNEVDEFYDTPAMFKPRATMEDFKESLSLFEDLSKPTDSLACQESDLEDQFMSQLNRRDYVKQQRAREIESELELDVKRIQALTTFDDIEASLGEISHAFIDYKIT